MPSKRYPYCKTAVAMTLPFAAAFKSGLLHFSTKYTNVAPKSSGTTMLFMANDMKSGYFPIQ